MSINDWTILLVQFSFLSSKSGYCQYLLDLQMLMVFALAPLRFFHKAAEINKVLFERGCEPAIRAVVL